MIWLCLGFVTHSIVSYRDLIYYDTPYNLWIVWETHFQQSNKIKIFRFKREIANLHQDQQFIISYYGKLKEIWDELASSQPTNPRTYGASKSLSEIQDSDWVYQFLMGLNDSFQQIWSQILATDPLPSIGYCNVIQWLVQPISRPEVSTFVIHKHPSKTHLILVAFGQLWYRFVKSAGNPTIPVHNASRYLVT